MYTLFSTYLDFQHQVQENSIEEKRRADKVVGDGRDIVLLNEDEVVINKIWGNCFYSFPVLKSDILRTIS